MNLTALVDDVAADQGVAKTEAKKIVEDIISAILDRATGRGQLAQRS